MFRQVQITYSRIKKS
jgi:hypothetical protein